MGETLTKLSGIDLATVLSRARLPPEAQAPLAGCAGVGEAIDRLEAAGFAAEAARVLALAMPQRECVWWTCVCAAHTAPPDLPEDDRQAREMAELWVRQQKDEPRRAAFAHAEKAGFQTPEAWAAAAAFWSGDSIAPIGQPAIPPGPELTGTAAAGSIALSAVRGDFSRQAARLKRFLESGRNIASGGAGRIPPEQS